MRNCDDSLIELVRGAQRNLMSAPRAQRSLALDELTRILDQRMEEILERNQRDLAGATSAGLSNSLIQRLKLTEAKIRGLIDGIRHLAGGEDPIGKTLKHTLLDDGLHLRQVTTPIGVLLVIFESRPDALIQIGSLAVHTSNAVILKGGKEATESNTILADCLGQALGGAGLDPSVIQLITTRDAAYQLLRQEDSADLVIPRGSKEMVQEIQKSTSIPVLGHSDGICHLYIDESASVETATAIVVDAKCDYPSACNAVECLIIHQNFLPRIRPVAEALNQRGVELRADPQCQQFIPWAKAAGPNDFSTEWGDLVLSVCAVDSTADAIRHINEFGSGHTDAIVTHDPDSAVAFVNAVDSTSVFVNASTRFADGYRFGLGAEVGISTARIHARGPVGAEGLLTTRWILHGQGQTASGYGPTGKAFKHLPFPLDSQIGPIL